MVDVIVVGAGIVGLATALALKEKSPELKIRVIEKESEVALHQTGNNSGVIHSGIYYKPGSLKANNCIDGYKRLISFCEANEIEHDICGKIIVATCPSEIPLLDNIRSRGEQNGLEGLVTLDADQLREYEPHVAGLAGVYVPQTGIIDFKNVSYKIASKFEELGGEIFFSEKVIDVHEQGDCSTLVTSKGSHSCKIFVNCAGLYSDKIARLTEEDINLRIIPFRGEYYELIPEKRSLVKNLIYPVPDPNFPFLGVHFTRMICGGVEAGPNAVFAFAREGYSKKDFNLSETLESLTWPGFLKVASRYWKTGIGEMYRSYSKRAFVKALQKLIPEVQENDLQVGGAGVRAQACDKSGGLVDDFVILQNRTSINVCNAPSPAATSSLAIGDKISNLCIERI